MIGATTWEQLAAFVSLAGTIGYIWWSVQKQITACAKALDEHKPHVSKRFIKAERLQKFEERYLPLRQ